MHFNCHNCRCFKVARPSCIYWCCKDAIHVIFLKAVLIWNYSFAAQSTTSQRFMYVFCCIDSCCFRVTTTFVHIYCHLVSSLLPWGLMNCAVLILMPHTCYLTGWMFAMLMLFCLFFYMLSWIIMINFPQLFISSFNLLWKTYHYTKYLPEAGAIFKSYHPQLYSDSIIFNIKPCWLST